VRVSFGTSIALLLVIVTGLAIALHAWHAIATGCYVDFVTGVWLALADDLSHGVFVRALIGPDGYGGTRYFPLFFTSIAGMMRLGLSPLASGFTVSAASAVLLVLGIRRLLSQVGLPRALAVACAVFVFAPRFTQQALFAVRSDILAAALVIWGLACTLPAFDEDPPRRRPLAMASVFFVLAAATKITSLYAPAAAILALAFARRFNASLRLCVMVVAGTTAMVGIVAVASGGRAIESWRACAFAGAGTAEWLANLPSAFLSQVIGPSRVFSAVFLAATIAWLAMLRANGAKLAIVLFPVTLGATTVVLASPGTSYTNQLIDMLAVCIVLIGWALARYPRLRSPAVLALFFLSLAAARQSMQPVMNRSLRQHAWQLSAERAELARELASGLGPVLSESPELPVLAGLRPYMIDPFALRVVTLRRPDVLRDVMQQLDTKRFSSVVLMYDPDSVRGRGWYTNMDFGWPIVSKILANYDFAKATAGLRVYVPRRPTPVQPGPAPP
jgi:hypothetical protein